MVTGDRGFVSAAAVLFACRHGARAAGRTLRGAFCLRNGLNA
jgi:hypothetical protein